MQPSYAQDEPFCIYNMGTYLNLSDGRSFPVDPAKGLIE